MKDPLALTPYEINRFPGWADVYGDVNWSLRRSLFVERGTVYWSRMRHCWTSPNWRRPAHMYRNGVYCHVGVRL